MNREEARNILENLSSDLWRELNPRQRDALDMAIEALEEQRPHGEWQQVGEMTYRCTNCGWLKKIGLMPFCENCGADMRKEGDAE